ncbi:hypothetical protein NLJ89_g8130 [Agrocybe chaxingu]|uniref:Uncharacterized protein n=1 Tax=Agrocybe chaxingu TaxID=84603 RepID=A0A9W8JVH3_9AGAR|nr:hypothetical protein NLJ89_g8130 [Agrocybe chaxingu]
MKQVAARIRMIPYLLAPTVQCIVPSGICVFKRVLQLKRPAIEASPACRPIVYQIFELDDPVPFLPTLDELIEHLILTIRHLRRREVFVKYRNCRPGIEAPCQRPVTSNRKWLSAFFFEAFLDFWCSLEGSNDEKLEAALPKMDISQPDYAAVALVRPHSPPGSSGRVANGWRTGWRTGGERVADCTPPWTIPASPFSRGLKCHRGLANEENLPSYLIPAPPPTAHTILTVWDAGRRLRHFDQDKCLAIPE